MKHQDRRNFLKAGTTLGASLLATSAFSFTSSSKKTIQGDEAKKHSANVRERTLGSGKHSLKVSALGLGCMGMSWNRSFVPDRKNSIDVIRKAYDMGVDFFDTAEAYGPFAMRS